MRNVVFYLGLLLSIIQACKMHTCAWSDSTHQVISLEISVKATYSNRLFLKNRLVICYLLTAKCFMNVEHLVDLYSKK